MYSNCSECGVGQLHAERTKVWTVHGPHEEAACDCATALLVHPRNGGVRSGRRVGPEALGDCRGARPEKKHNN